MPSQIATDDPRWSDARAEEVPHVAPRHPLLVRMRADRRTCRETFGWTIGGTSRALINGRSNRWA